MYSDSDSSPLGLDSEWEAPELVWPQLPAPLHAWSLPTFCEPCLAEESEAERHTWTAGSLEACSSSPARRTKLGALGRHGALSDEDAGDAAGGSGGGRPSAPPGSRLGDDSLSPSPCLSPSSSGGSLLNDPESRSPYSSSGPAPSQEGGGAGPAALAADLSSQLHGRGGGGAGAQGRYREQHGYAGAVGAFAAPLRLSSSQPPAAKLRRTISDLDDRATSLTSDGGPPGGAAEDNDDDGVDDEEDDDEEGNMPVAMTNGGGGEESDLEGIAGDGGWQEGLDEEARGYDEDDEFEEGEDDDEAYDEEPALSDSPNASADNDGGPGPLRHWVPAFGNLDPNGSGSEEDDGEWQAGSSSDEAGSSSDEEDAAVVRRCINCTSRYGDSAVCPECGHAEDDDELLFSAQQPNVRPLWGAGRQPVLLAFDDRMTLHRKLNSRTHPERPDRIRAIIARLQSSLLPGQCERLTAREATRPELLSCHTPELVDGLEAASRAHQARAAAGLSERPAHFGSLDTYTNAHTYNCARLAAGACVEVATRIATGQAPCGAAVVRPPGHHAESSNAMGFCFFNNAGIAARAAQAAGARRVLILDWDIHYGNGTAEIFREDSSVLYMSIHRHDGGYFFPGNGKLREVGRGRGEGFNVCIPWSGPGMCDGDYMAAFHRVILPIAYEFAPDLVIVSAGFDAARGDPIGGCLVSEEMYGQMTSLISAVAPTCVLLEGGYNLRATARATEACLRALLGEQPRRPPGRLVPSMEACAVLQDVIRVQSRYWQCLRGLVPPRPVQQQPPLDGGLQTAQAYREYLARQRVAGEVAAAPQAGGEGDAEAGFEEEAAFRTSPRPQPASPHAGHAVTHPHQPMPQAPPPAPPAEASTTAGFSGGEHSVRAAAEGTAETAAAPSAAGAGVAGMVGGEWTGDGFREGDAGFGEGEAGGLLSGKKRKKLPVVGAMQIEHVKALYTQEYADEVGGAKRLKSEPREVVPAGSGDPEAPPAAL